MARLRTLTLWLLSGAVALTTAVVVASDLASLHRRAATLGPPTPVVVADDDLPLGRVVAAGDVTTVTVPESLAPAGAIRAVDDAVGRVVAVPLVEGATVTDRHLVAGRRDGQAGLVAPGTRAVHLSDAGGLAVEPGAVVDVMVSLDPSLVAAEGGGEAVVTVAGAARVIAVDAPPEDEFVGSRPTGVTLLVSEQEARRLAFAAANGVLTLALAPPEDACCPTDPGESDS